jgi:drug/metabolite transporter (DMT)-like permease
VSFGSYLVVLSFAGGESGMWPLVASRGSTTLLLVVVAGAVRSQWLPPPRGTIGLAVAGVGVMDLAGNVGYLLAVSRAPLVVVAVVASLYPAVTVLAARLAHGEKVTPVQAVGIGLAAAAVALFSVG